MYNQNYIKNLVNDCKREITKQKQFIIKLINFYNEYKDIDINNLSVKEENNFFNQFENIKQFDNGYLIISKSEHPIISDFDKKKFCKLLTGKNFIKKNIYLDQIYINDVYDDKYLDYLCSELLRHKVDILCDKNFDNNKIYSVKELLNLFRQKEIIILALDTVRSKSFSCFNKDVILNGVLQSPIIIGDYLAKKGTELIYNSDEIDSLKALCLPNIYNFGCSFDTYRIIYPEFDTYIEIYPEFAKIAIKEILKMIPNEIKLRRENIEKLIQDTKNDVISYSKEYKQWLKKELSEQDKLTSESVEELDNTIEDNFTL